MILEFRCMISLSHPTFSHPRPNTFNCHFIFPATPRGRPGRGGGSSMLTPPSRLSYLISSSSTSLEERKALEETVFVYLLQEETAGGTFDKLVCRSGTSEGKVTVTQC